MPLRQPSARVTLEAPGFPDPTVVMSMPLARATSAALGNVPSRYAAGSSATHTAITVRKNVTGWARCGLEWSIAGRGALPAPTRASSPWPLHALGVGTVERQAGEELGRHAAALARVVAAAGCARTGRLRLAELEEQVAVAPDAREAALVAHDAGPELVVDDERARVHVADRVDEAHDAPGTAHVEAGQRLAERVEVEERVARQHVVAVGQQPLVDLALLGVGRMQVVPRVGATARRTQARDPQLRAVGVGERLELVELIDVVAGDDDGDLERTEARRQRRWSIARRAMAYEPSPRTASLVTASVPSRLIWMSR